MQLLKDAQVEDLQKLLLGEPVPGVPQSDLLAELAKETVALGRQRALTGDASLDRVQLITIGAPKPATSALTPAPGPVRTLADMRAQVLEEVGGEGLVDACAVIGMFNAMNKVADMSGVRLDPTFFEAKSWSPGYSAFVSVVALAMESLRLSEFRKGEGVRLTSATSKL